MHCIFDLSTMLYSVSRETNQKFFFYLERSLPMKPKPMSVFALKWRRNSVLKQESFRRPWTNSTQLWTWVLQPIFFSAEFTTIELNATKTWQKTLNIREDYGSLPEKTARKAANFPLDGQWPSIYASPSTSTSRNIRKRFATSKKLADYRQERKRIGLKSGHSAEKQPDERVGESLPTCTTIQSDITKEYLICTKPLGNHLSASTGLTERST